MSNKKDVNLQKIRVFWEKYEKTVVLISGFVLVAIISFEIGVLSGNKIEQKSLVIEKSPEIAEIIKESAAPAVVLGVENEAQSKRENNPAESANLQGKECLFVGSKNSDKYHKPDCRFAKNIKPENLVCFKSEEEAKNRGYVGDKGCVGK